MVKINSHDLALFQPVTAFVSSLTFIKSEHISTIQTLETSKLNCITDSDSTESRAPLEAGLCVNLDRLFATSSGKMNYSNITHIMVLIVGRSVRRITAGVSGAVISSWFSPSFCC